MEVCELVHTAQPNYSAYKYRKQQRSCMLTFHLLTLKVQGSTTSS